MIDDAKVYNASRHRLSRPLKHGRKLVPYSLRFVATEMIKKKSNVDMWKFGAHHGTTRTIPEGIMTTAAMKESGVYDTICRIIDQAPGEELTYCSGNIYEMAIVMTDSRVVQISSLKKKKIVIGNSDGKLSKTVSVKGRLHDVSPKPVNAQRPTWNDRFAVEVVGQSVSVRRVDRPTSWGQRLELMGRFIKSGGRSQVTSLYYREISSVALDPSSHAIRCDRGGLKKHTRLRCGNRYCLAFIKQELEDKVSKGNKRTVSSLASLRV